MSSTGVPFYEVNGEKQDRGVHEAILSGARLSEKYKADSLKRTASLGVPEGTAKVPVEKANPYHDEKGLFTSKDKAVESGLGGILSAYVTNPGSLSGEDSRKLSGIAERSLTKAEALIRISREDPKYEVGGTVSFGKPTSMSRAVSAVLEGDSIGHIGWSTSDRALVRIKSPVHGLDVDYSKVDTPFSAAGEKETIVAGKYLVESVSRVTEPGTDKQYGYTVPMYTLVEVPARVRKVEGLIGGGEGVVYERDSGCGKDELQSIAKVTIAPNGGFAKILKELQPSEKPAGGGQGQESGMLSALKAVLSVLKFNPNHDEKGRFAKVDYQNDPLPKLESVMKAKYGVSFVNSVRDKVYGADWGSSMPKEAWAQHERNIMMALAYTMDDAKTRGLHMKNLGMKVLRRDASGHNGNAAAGEVSGRTVAIGTGLFDQGTVAAGKLDALAMYDTKVGLPHLAAQGIIAHTANSPREDALNYAAAIIRHEVGHNLTQNKHIKQVMSLGAETIKGSVFTEYSKTDAHEYLSEAFSLYTSKVYKPGTYPDKVVSILEDMSKPLRQRK